MSKLETYWAWSSLFVVLAYAADRPFAFFVAFVMAMYCISQTVREAIR